MRLWEPPSDEELRELARDIVAAEDAQARRTWQKLARKHGWLPPDEIRAKVWSAYLTDRRTR